MTYKTFLTSMEIIKKLSQISLPIEKTFKIFSLLEEVSNQYDVFVKTYNNLKERFPHEDFEGGRIKFKSEEDAKVFVQEEDKMFNMEVPFSKDYKKIELTTADLKDSNITPLEMFQLKDFFDFKE